MFNMLIYEGSKIPHYTKLWASMHNVCYISKACAVNDSGGQPRPVLPPSPKWLSYFPDFFCPKVILWLFAQLEIEAQRQIVSHQTFYIKKSFDTTTSGGRFGVVVVFYFKSR